MKKISEMSLEELQVYALDLEEKTTALTAQNAEKDKKIEEVNGYNAELQRYNNTLLMKVEQQNSGNDPEPEEEKEVKTESCEDFARRLIEGGKK